MTVAIVQDKATVEETQLKGGDEAHKKAAKEAKQTTGVKDIVGEAEEHKARGNSLLKDGEYTETMNAYTKRIVWYLDELMEVMQTNPAMQDIEGGDAYGVEAAELLEECGPGTVSVSQLGMQETLEDKQKKLQREQTMSALRLKYTAEIEEQAQKLIKRQVEASTLYSPEEVKELEKRLRRIMPKEEPQRAVAEEPQSAVAKETQRAISEEPQISVDTVSTLERPRKIRSAWLEYEPTGANIFSVDTVSTCERPRKIRSAWLEYEPTGANIEVVSEAASQKMGDVANEREVQETSSSQKKAPHRNNCWQGCIIGLTRWVLAQIVDGEM